MVGKEGKWFVNKVNGCKEGKWLVKKENGW